jgi:hypothetical protein
MTGQLVRLGAAMVAAWPRWTNSFSEREAILEEPKPAHIKRLFSGWPGLAAGLTPEQVGLYVEATAIFDAGDLLQAVNDFLFGKVPEHNKKFLPSVSELSDHARRIRNARVDVEAQEKRRKRQLLAPPDGKKEPEDVRKATIERLRAETGGFLIKPMRLDASEKEREHRAKVDRFILDALAGDKEALGQFLAASPVPASTDEFLASIGRPRETVGSQNSSTNS